MKKYDSFFNKREKYTQLINKILLPNTKTIYNTSRNHENPLNLIYKNALSKSDKNFAFKTDSNYFLSEMKNMGSNLKYKLLSKKSDSIKKAKSINKYEEMKDFSNVIKHLEKWDKEHCFFNKDKGNISLLYKNLTTYYRNNNMINEEKNINLIDNMLKVKPDFRQFVYNNYINQNKLLKELIMRSPTKIIEKDENNKDKDNNKIKSDSNNKDVTNNENEDIFTNLLNKKKEDKKNNFFPHKIMKERIKYEKELHQKLFFLNNLLFNKKYIKDEKKKELDKLYETKNKLISDYNDTFNKDIKNYWIRYDEYDHNFKKRKQILNPEIAKERKGIKKKTTMETDYISSQLKNMEYLKNNKISKLNYEMIQKQKLLKKEYIEKYKQLNNQKDTLENDIKIINYELEYYKHVNDELLREYKSYYMEILKKGFRLKERWPFMVGEKFN